MAQLQLAGQTCNAQYTCTILDSCNTELPICTRLCMGSINFCEFSACSFSYLNCPFLSLPRSSLRSFFFAATAVSKKSSECGVVRRCATVPFYRATPWHMFVNSASLPPVVAHDVGRVAASGVCGQRIMNPRIHPYGPQPRRGLKGRTT